MNKQQLESFGINGLEAQNLAREYVMRMKATGISSQDIKTILQKTDIYSSKKLYDIFRESTSSVNSHVLLHLMRNAPDNEEMLEKITLLARMPYAESVALMPSATPHDDIPNGSVLLTNNAYVPSAIGSDIGCAVSMTLLPLKARHVDRYTIGQIIYETTAFNDDTIPTVNVNYANKFINTLNYIPDLASYQEEMKNRLGMLGGDSHFVNVMTLMLHRQLFNQLNLDTLENNPWEVDETYIVIVVHAGSNGIGRHIKEKYLSIAEDFLYQYDRSLPSEYAWIDSELLVGKQFYNTIDNLLWYVQINHDIIHHNIIRELHSVYDFNSTVKTIYSVHNSITKLDDSRIIHRKNAIPSIKDNLSVIMGTVTDPCHIVTGASNNNWLKSAGHGFPRYKIIDNELSLDKEVLSHISSVLLIGGREQENPKNYNKYVIKEQIGKTFFLQGKLIPFVSRMAK